MKAVSPLTSSLEVFKQKGNSALSSPFKELKALDISHLLQQVSKSCHQGGCCSKHPLCLARQALTAPFAGAFKQRLHFNSFDVMPLKSEQNPNYNRSAKRRLPEGCPSHTVYLRQEN